MIAIEFDVVMTDATRTRLHTTKYLNEPSVQLFLGIPKGLEWEECSDSVNMMFDKDRLANVAQDLVPVLAAKVPVLVYSGMLDLICNYMGGIQWTNDLQWPFKAQFNAAPTNPWSGGSIQQSNGLAMASVANAGHMSPHDQPVQVSLLISCFVGSVPCSFLETIN